MSREENNKLGLCDAEYVLCSKLWVFLTQLTGIKCVLVIFWEREHKSLDTTEGNDERGCSCCIDMQSVLGQGCRKLVPAREMEWAIFEQPHEV